jgi:methionyl-tRNA formyltransferase
MATQRIVLISNILPAVEPLVPYLRELGHEPVAWLTSRRPEHVPDPPWGPIHDRNAPKGLSLFAANDKHAIEPFLRGFEPDVVLCMGFSWKLPQEALDVARLGSVNWHPALLPRHRGPYPIAWTFREGDAEFGITWHRMDAEFDTGPILAQATVPIEDDDTLIMEYGEKISRAGLSILPRVFERLEAGDPGDPQEADGSAWASTFGEDYATIDWSQTAREVHNQVRAWSVMFGAGEVQGPIAELDGERLKILRTSLTDPGGDARRVECGDAPIWIVESEPAA